MDATDTNPPSSEDKLTAAQKAELYKWLSDSAWLRVEKRRTIEWRVYFGIWTGSGALAAFLFSTEATLNNGQFTVIAIASLSVCGSFICLWLPWLQSSHRLDQRTGYWWSSKVEELCGTSLPEAYFPPLIAKEKWLRADTPVAELGSGKWETKQLHSTWLGSLLHRGATSVIVITLALWLLVLTAAAGRIRTSEEPTAAVKIEKLQVSNGTNVHITTNDSTEKPNTIPPPVSIAVPQPSLPAGSTSVDENSLAP